MNGIAKAKLSVWLAIEEGVFSMELHLCMKQYCWRELRGKFLKKLCWRYTELFFVWVNWEIPVLIMFWIKFCTVVKHSSVTGVLELSGALITDLDLDCVRLTLPLTKWQFWQLSLKWLSGARAQDKTKQYYCCFFSFFPRVYTTLQFKKNSLPDSLNCTWKPISHS